jgi:DNA-binding beta-propeller fold protein YncE
MIEPKRTFRRSLLIAIVAMLTHLSIAQTPSPALVVTSKGKGGKDCVLQIIDPVAGKMVARVPLGGTPHNVAVSSDGKFAFTGNIVSGVQWENYPTVSTPKRPTFPTPLPDDSISVIDLVAQKEVRLIPVGPGSEPHGITFAGGKVFVNLEGYKLVARIDPQTNRIDWMGGIGQNRVHELVVTKDAAKIFTANIGSNTVSVVAPWDKAGDTQTYSKGHEPPPWNTSLVTVGLGPEGIALAPNEKEVWVLNRGESTVAIIDANTKKLVQTFDPKTSDPLRIVFTPDGKRVLIADGKSGDLLIIDRAERTEIKRIKDVGKDAHGLVVAPDGEHAYIAAGGYVGVGADNNVAIVDMNKLEVTGRIPIGEQSEGMAWVGKE